MFIFFLFFFTFPAARRCFQPWGPHVPGSATGPACSRVRPRLEVRTLSCTLGRTGGGGVSRGARHDLTLPPRSITQADRARACFLFRFLAPEPSPSPPPPPTKLLILVSRSAGAGGTNGSSAGGGPNAPLYFCKHAKPIDGHVRGGMTRSCTTCEATNTDELPSVPFLLYNVKRMTYL